MAIRNKVRAVSRQLKRVKRAAASERVAYFRSQPIQPNVVCYESFGGNGVLCNPEAIFRSLLADATLANLQHVWLVADDATERAFNEQYGADKRVSVVRRGTSAYQKTIATAGYLINNATFPAQFGKRPGQIYLNTWHGTPLKQMGFDMPDGARQSANVLRNFLNADFLLAANPFMAEVMYEQAYKLTNIFEGEIIEEGYPRIDRQWLTANDRLDAENALLANGIDIEDRRVVLFAPTWRGANFSKVDQDVDELGERALQLQAALGDDTIVLLKTHQSVHEAAAGRATPLPNLVPNTIPTNVMLGLSDALITDYSSIFFDFLATDRPIAFFTPDAEHYGESRGTYMPLSELPGPVSADPTEVGTALRALMDGAPAHEQYASWRERFVPFEDGHATERVIDIVFRGKREGYRVRPAKHDGRIPVMFYLGGMRSNGITTSALNLLHNIDHDKYDVTAFSAMFTRAAQQRANQDKIDPRVRQVFRMGAMNGSKFVQVRRHLDNRMLRSRRPSSRGWHTQLWKQEWERLLGSARFQWVADFSGYGAFWTNLLLHAPARRRAIWLHNEMISDRDRTVDGKKPLHRNLSLVFELYPFFDALVSVSPTLSRHNREGLRDYARPEAFKTVRNLPNVEAVEAGRAVPLDEAVRPRSDGTLRPWVESLMDKDRAERWFVTVARLSPEKNQERLIRAFAQVHAERPEARLLIVGAGPLRKDLKALIAELGLNDVAFLAGGQSNPWAIMDAADCFVMSSRYEGQPMVLLEAALCELPIISTRFASVADALEPGMIHIVDQDDDALRDGMLAFFRGEIEPSSLDIPSYTADVLAELDDVIATSNPTVPIHTIR